jgi:glyoxylase I family protein
MSFTVERIDHVVLRVRSLPAMVEFYERALGFKVVRRLDRLKLVQMRAGASMLDLIDKERGGADGNMDHLCFRIEPFDRDAIAARLSPLGITVGETVERFGAEGTGPSVYFDDPEGNQIELKGPATSGVPAEGAAH